MLYFPWTCQGKSTVNHSACVGHTRQAGMVLKSTVAIQRQQCIADMHRDFASSVLVEFVIHPSTVCMRCSCSFVSSDML